jgi:hypothetical protein
MTGSWQKNFLIFATISGMQAPLPHVRQGGSVQCKQFILMTHDIRPAWIGLETLFQARSGI